MRRSHQLISAALLALTACGHDTDSGAPASMVSVADSPEYVIRVDDGTDQLALSSITSAVLLDEGIAVLDRLDLKVHVYNDSGILVRSFGRSGEGPGEFRMPGWIGNCGVPTRLAVRDPTRGLMLFDTRGELTATIALPPNVGAVACSGENIALMIVGGSPGLPSADDPPISGSVALVNDGGLTTAIIPDTAIYYDRPLGAVARMAMVDDHVVFGSSTDDIVMLHEAGTGNRRTITLGIPARHPTDQEYSAAIDRLVAMMLDEETRTRVRGMLERIAPPERIPAFRAMAGGSDGLLWLITSPLGSPSSETLVVNLASGKRLGTITLPPDVEIVSVSGGKLAVMRPDTYSGEKMLEIYRYAVKSQ